MSSLYDKCVAVAEADGTLPPDFDAARIRSACACIAKIGENDAAKAQELEAALNIPAFADRMAALTPETRAQVEACLQA